MWKIETNKFTVSQRDGKDPDIVITSKRYWPIVDKTTKKHLKKKVKGKPIDYGITEEQFDTILKKAAQPRDK